MEKAAQDCQCGKGCEQRKDGHSPPEELLRFHFFATILPRFDLILLSLWEPFALNLALATAMAVVLSACRS